MTLSRPTLETEMDKHVFLAVFEFSGYARKIVKIVCIAQREKRWRIKRRRQNVRLEGSNPLFVQVLSIKWKKEAIVNGESQYKSKTVPAITFETLLHIKGTCILKNSK